MTNKSLSQYFLLLSVFAFCISIALPVMAELPEDLESRAEQGDTTAQYELGRVYELGKRVKSDINKAIKWYTRAADNSNVEASYRLGYIYYRGRSVKHDLPKAFQYLKQAAEHNHKRAQTYLARMYQKGQGTAKNKQRADYWYDQAFSPNMISFKQFIAARSGSTSEPVKARPKPAPEPEPEPQQQKAPQRFVASDITGYLIKHQWTAGGRPTAYVRSTLTRCKDKGEKLLCTSGKLTGNYRGELYKYKVRSIIEDAGDENEFDITYKRLITKVPEKTVTAYEDDSVLDENALTIGWEKNSHTIGCSIKKAGLILCRPIGADAFYLKAR